ncbi:SpoIIE family protein phosphatase [Anoxybacillus rupiensis]|uniref:SpoIIE family protein phosphatase n=1 Tax=Anoxybacteroides rupiense TaxID=311460 RepID=A0ABT5W397_9BACL|nr:MULTISPECIES: SpoIIE family protein phosphatase [Anoxybacillus]MBS2771855.1 SpoIIE family protein phosphatase [Anoxybacillus rupiensis]MDE8563782.1 SpoIIE family protein phosphatase [Anoxybacillus rupiensis]QHC04190.1 SpoIIE family protein phosphatase [Anoxybacillus sp. PDR2]
MKKEHVYVSKSEEIFHRQEGIIITNRDARIVAVNEILLASIGYRQQQLIGQPVHLLFTQSYSISTYHLIWENVLKEGYWDGNVHSHQLQDGLLLRRLTVYGLADHHGQNNLFIWKFSDILEIENVLNAIYKIPMMAVVTLYKDMTIKHWSEAAELLFGWKKEEIIGRPLLSLFSYHLFDLAKMIRQTGGEGLLDLECEARKRDTTMMNVVFSVVPVTDSVGATTGYVMTIRDVTKVKQKEREQQKNSELIKNIQQSIFTSPIQTKDITMDAVYIPSEELSGDMYACYRIDEVRFGVIIIDIMCRGLSSSLIIMLLRSQLRELILRVTDPACVATELEKYVQTLFPESSREMSSLFSMIYAVIDTKKQQIEYINAGHPSGFLLTNNEIIEMDQGGWAIGSPFSVPFKKEVIHYNQQVRLFLYTDGILGEIDQSPLSSMIHILHDLKEHRSLSDQQFLRLLVDKHICENRPANDVCMLSMTIGEASTD